MGSTSTLNWVGEAVSLSVDQSWLGADNNHIAINNDVGNILFDSRPLLRKLSPPIFQFYVYVGPLFYAKHLQGP